jgi:hypothetical protein
VEKSLSYQAKREVLHQMAPKYREASVSQKRTLLEAFIAATGYYVNTRGGSSTMPRRCNRRMGAHIFEAQVRMSNTRSSWSAMPPIASAPNA